MTQLSVMDLAKQGDPQAIAALINRSLASKGIHATAELAGSCLRISLYASQIPNPKAVITIIQRGMLILQVEKIKRLKILTYRSDNNYLAWQQEIELDRPNQSRNDFQGETLQSMENNAENRTSSDADIIASELSEPALLSQKMPSSNINLANTSKGVILVQSLSQIQQNLQEYQDVIVRFTDEQVGTVRCLTTLTELIQVISKPSFLFAAVASNPNLRSLLDAIAESSHTDEHGDQVIQNLSILQPGQQWQKAKVRLVTKIFLEPAQTADGGDRATNRQQDRHQGITLDLAEEITNAISENAPEPPSKALLVDAVEAEPIQDVSQDLLERLSKQLSEKLSEEAIAELLNESVINEPVINKPVINEPVINDSLIDETEIVTPDPSADVTELEVSIDSNITAEALFDDFVISSTTAKDLPHKQQEQPSSQSVVNELISPDVLIPSEMPEASGFDLFDGFGSSNSESNIAPKIAMQAEENLSLGDLIDDFDSDSAIKTRQINDDTLTFNTDDDLFNNFGAKSGDKSVDSSHISNVTDSSPNLEVNTIEGLISSIDSITLPKPASKPRSPSFVTLADFSEDLESVGF